MHSFVRQVEAVIASLQYIFLDGCKSCPYICYLMMCLKDFKIRTGSKLVKLVYHKNCHLDLFMVIIHVCGNCCWIGSVAQCA